MIHYWANKRKTRPRLKEEDFQQSEFELQIPDLVQPFDQMVELHCQIKMKKREKISSSTKSKRKTKWINFSLLALPKSIYSYCETFFGKTISSINTITNTTLHYWNVEIELLYKLPFTLSSKILQKMTFCCRKNREKWISLPAGDDLKIFYSHDLRLTRCNTILQ